MTDKPTLMQLRRQHNQHAHTTITSQQLAHLAHVELADEFLMELGRPVDARIAQRVMRAFSALAGHPYTLADITTHLKGGDAA